jgi:hypothetical protein
MRVVLWISAPWLASCLIWAALVACLDVPLPEEPGVARVITAWDPRTCGEPHRVVVELEAEADGAFATAGAPCANGVIVLDVPHRGRYRARIYAWELGAHAPSIRSELVVDVMVDDAVVRWLVQTPA